MYPALSLYKTAIIDFGISSVYAKLMPSLLQNNFSRKKFSRRKSFDLYKKVIELRKKEYSYTEIRRETGLAKSTIQNWLTYAGLTLSKEHLEIQAKKRIENCLIATEASKRIRAQRKEADIQDFIMENKKYLVDPFFVSGIMLYEAEGTKGDNNGFSNSDFRLILTYVRFLEKYFALDRNKDMVFRLYIHETRKNDLLKIVKFWSKKISISSDKIKLSWKHNIVVKRRFNSDYLGQFEVRVRGAHHFTSKLLSISDIILGKLLRN
ncbi:MAG: hypothetical protein ABIJ05_03040 [Patescibacteria group bacterium]